ncbi:hypothetical protein ScPMuIL_000653 [Solemya velum]
MENVIKQGYLRKAKLSAHSQSTLKMNIMQVFEPMRWYVFVVRDGKAYLEYYDREESIFSESAINMFDLSTCSKITYTLGRTNRNHTFCIILSERILELTADSRESMVDWCNVLERNLKNMGILSTTNDDHVYAPFESIMALKKKPSEPQFDSYNSSYSDSSDIPTLRTPPIPPLASSQSVIRDPVLYERSKSDGFDVPDRDTVQQTVNTETENGVDLRNQNVADGGSDEDTSADPDFVRASFWLRNRRTLHLDQGSHLSSFLTDLSVTKDQSHNSSDVPIPKPRKKRLQTDFGSQVRPNYQLIDIPPAVPNRAGPMEPGTKIVDIEDLDDGYQTIVNVQRPNKSESLDKIEVSEPNKYGIGKLFVDLPEPEEKGDKLDCVTNGDSCSSSLQARENSCNGNVSNSLHSSPMHRNHNPSMSKSKSENLYAPFPISDTEMNSKHSDFISQPEMQIYEPVTPLTSVMRTNSVTGLSRESENKKASSAYVPEEYQSPIQFRASESSGACASSVSNPIMSYRENIYEDISFRNPPPVPARPMSTFTDPPPIVPVRLKSVNRRSGEFVRRIPSPIPSASKTDEDLKKSCSSAQKSTSHLPCGAVNVTLKQSQVELLQEEMEPAGIIITLPTLFCQQALALVGAFDGVWIAGWDVQKGPRQYDRFHLGDRLLAINNDRVTNIAMAQKHLRGIMAVEVELTIKRLPYGQVFIIKRSAEGESLGIKREGGTAEIIYVDPNGIAAKHGLSKNAQNVLGDTICNWCLTEINNRPLNLFFKNVEIEHRLNAVGRDISFVVQPIDFIRELKKQLKRIKNYKDFLVQ